MLKEVIPGSVALLSPCANTVEPKAYQFAMNLVAGAWKGGVPVNMVGVTERTLIHSARNILAEGFLNTECEWAFWLDSDMVLPSNTIPTMLRWAKKLKAEFLTGVYYQRIGEHRPLVLIRDEKRDKWGGFNVQPPAGDKRPFRVDYCGFGAVLTHRNVFEKLPKPWFKYDFIEGKDFSEDFYFCEEARKANIPLWAIPELECLHIGQAPLIGRSSFKGETKKVLLEAYEDRGDDKT